MTGRLIQRLSAARFCGVGLTSHAALLSSRLLRPLVALLTLWQTGAVPGVRRARLLGSPSQVQAAVATARSVTKSRRTARLPHDRGRYPSRANLSLPRY